MEPKSDILGGRGRNSRHVPVWPWGFGAWLRQTGVKHGRSQERRKMVMEQVHRQEEMIRGEKAVAQAKQGQWLNWESVEKRKLSRRDL